MSKKAKTVFSSDKAEREFNDIRDRLVEENDEAVLFDGLEDALIGISHRFGASAVATYDIAKIIDIYVKRDGMTIEEAEEFFDYNVIGTGVKGAPAFVEIFRDAFANPK